MINVSKLIKSQAHTEPQPMIAIIIIIMIMMMTAMMCTLQRMLMHLRAQNQLHDLDRSNKDRHSCGDAIRFISIDICIQVQYNVPITESQNV